MQRLGQNGGEPLVKPERFEHGRIDIDADDRRLDLCGAVALDRRVAGQGFIPDQSQGEHVRGSPQATGREMLRRHVARGADQCVAVLVLLALHPRQPKIHDARYAVDVDLDVAGAQIEMQHLLLVGMRQTAHQLRHERRCRAHRQPPVLPQIVLQRGALDVFEHQERPGVVQAGLVHGDHVGVLELAEVASLFERVAGSLPLRGLTAGGRRQRRAFQELDGHQPVEMGVVALEYVALQAAAQHFDDLEPPDPDRNRRFR